MTEYYYQCLPKRLYQKGNYTLEAVQSEHIEKVRQWRNEQMDILRQSNPISKDDQIQYYENHIWSITIFQIMRYFIRLAELFLRPKHKWCD